MATTADKTTLSIPTGIASGNAIHQSEAMKRRSIDPQAGHALIILGHAIEYLTDEFIAEGGSFTENRGRVDAIQLLIKLNREIYLACPEAPSIGHWLSTLLSYPFKRVSTAKKSGAGPDQGRI